LTVQQALLNLDAEKVRLNAAKMEFSPSLEASVGQNFSFGRATTANALIRDNYSQSSTSFGINLNMPLFTGLKNYNNLKSQQISVKASQFDLEQNKETITLNVIAYYLQVLLDIEIYNVSVQQLQLSEAQVDRIQLLFQNGKCAESELFNAQAIAASDKVVVTQNLNNYRLALLDLAQLINVEDVANFEVEPLADSEINLWLNKDIDLQKTVHSSIENRPQIKAAQLRIDKGLFDIRSAKSGWYPSLGLTMGYGTSYYYAFGDSIPNIVFGEQFRNHASPYIMLNLSIPLFDRLRTHHNVRLAKIERLTQQNRLEEDKRELTKNIYQAFYNADAAKENLKAATQSVEASRLAFQYEEMKYNEGKSTAYQYSEAKNKYQEATSQAIRAKYECAFRMEILEFYSR
jgi:outer membrane protein